MRNAEEAVGLAVPAVSVMSDAAGPYCLADVDNEDDPPTVLGSFDEVVAHLRSASNTFADEIARLRAGEEVRDLEPVGGIGVLLRNRWGSEVEVGVGRDVWFLFRHLPRPRRCFSDGPAVEGYLVFYLGGGHHTELRRDMLVSRAACLQALRQWLEQDEFPAATEPAKA